MEKKSLFLYLFCLLFLMSCVENQNSKDGFTVKKIEIDIKKVENINSDYFLDSVRYVKLETGSENLIRGIKKIVYSNGIFYILDNSMNAIYVFDKQGHFLYNINHQGPGPQEYIGIDDFTISESDSIITFVDMNSRNIVNYKLGTGNFIRKDAFTYYISNIVAFAKKDYLGFDVNTGAVVMDSVFKVKEKLLQYSFEIPLPGNDVGYIYKMKDSCGIFSPYDNSIYHVKEGSIKKKYILKYVGMKTPLNFPLNNNLNYEQALAKMKEKGIVVVVHRETDNWIFQILAYQKNNVLIYILYSKNNDKLTVIGDIDNFKNIWFNSFSLSEMNNCLIQATTLPIEELKKQIENTPNRFTKDFIEIVQSSKEDDNPVLQLLYLKK